MEIQTINIPKKFTIISYEIGSRYHKVVDTLKTKSQGHFARKLRLLNSQIECYLRVTYKGGGHNDGYYDNKSDLMLAYKAFCEK